MNADSRFSTWEEAVVWLKRQPDRAQLVVDCYYDDPLVKAADRYWRSEEWQAVRALLAGRTGQALDIGAGRGIASYALARDGFMVTALEPDPSALVGAQAIRSLAAEAGLPITVVEEFSERLPFENGAFDLVFARAVLHHTRDLQSACREFHRVLKPGGLLMAIREHVISHPKDLPAFLEQHPLHRYYGGENAFLLKQYVMALKRAGFEQVNVIGPWHSPINFAPHTLETLKDELVHRLGLGMPKIVRGVRALLRLPGAWRLLRRCLEMVDRRPGRLYSFVAERGKE